MEKRVFVAKIENLPAMLQFIKEKTQECGFNDKVINLIQLAAEEALVNVINYAYPDKSGDVEVTCTPKEKGLQIEIVDSGIAFDPLALPEPNINAPLEKRRIGGLGIYMFRKLMDEISYRRQDSRNILTLLKYK